MSRSTIKLTIGGDVQADNGTYISRPADDQLLDACRAGEFSYVLASRQIGKSSLKNAVAGELKKQGICVVRIDLNIIGQHISKPDIWYLTLMEEILNELRIKIDIDLWWRSKSKFLTTTRRFLSFFDEIVLDRIKDPIVIFIDEIDVTIGMPFTDDFFAVIRAIYNYRAQNLEYRRITFVLLGVASPYELINDIRRTPFNIGKPISIHDFTIDEGSSLRLLIDEYIPGKGYLCLREIFKWTNGHPYLTQKLCDAVVKAARAGDFKSVDEIVNKLFLSDYDRTEDNIKFVHRRIIDDKESQKMLRIYRSILKGKDVPDNKKSTAINRLKLSGLVVLQRDLLVPRNRIYSSLFDMKWIREYADASFIPDLVILIIIEMSFMIYFASIVNNILLNMIFVLASSPIVYVLIRQVKHLFYHWIRLINIDLFGRYRRIYNEHIIYRYRDFDMKGFSTRGIYNLEQENVYVSLALGPQVPNHISAGLINTIPEQLHIGDHSIWEYMCAPRMADRHFAIIGAPGSGKTTLLKHIALTFALRQNRRVKPSMLRRTPILLFLRDLFAYIKDNPDLNLVDLIQRSLTILEIAPPDGWLEAELRKSRCIIMLDGLDEIADLQIRQRVVTWVERQMAIYARNRFIITSRPLGYRSNPLGGVDVLEVRPFTSTQVKRFIGNWYQAIEVMSSAKNDPGVQENARKGAEDLLRRLAHAPSLTELAANPLLLTMSATIHRYRSMLPERRVDFYKEICEVFLGKRRQAHNLDLELAPTQKQSVLQPLAYQMMLHQQQVISSDEALHWIREPLASISQNKEGAAFLREIEESSGLLLERESGIYSFAHKTFQEYLAAMHIKDERLEAELITKVEDPWWHETILLYAAQKDASDILNACFQSGNPSIRALSLAKECLREAHSIKPALRAKVVEFFEHNAENDEQSRRLAAEVLIINRLGRLARLDEQRQIDTMLVTHAEYQLFLDESRALGKYYQPDHWLDLHFQPGQGQLPIAGVRPTDAQAFCAWLTEREGEWHYALPRSGSEELFYNAPAGNTGYWAESDGVGFLCEGLKYDSSEEFKVLLEQNIDEDLANLQVFALVVLIDDIRSRLRFLVSDRASDLMLLEARQTAILIAEDLELAQRLARECRYAQYASVVMSINLACGAAREIARGFDQAARAASESVRARDTAEERAQRLVDENDRARGAALNNARDLLRLLSSSNSWLADLRQAMVARLPKQSELKETLPRLFRSATGSQRDLFRALAGACSSTRAQALSRMRTYIYTPSSERIQAFGDRQGFGIDHTHALECLRVFDRAPGTLRERHAPLHPDRCYLRYWALLCSVFLEGGAGEQRRARTQARQQINNRAETCYGVYLDVVLLEARLAGQAPAVEGIRLMREHRIEI